MLIGKAPLDRNLGSAVRVNSTHMATTGCAGGAVPFSVPLPRAPFPGLFRKGPRNRTLLPQGASRLFGEGSQRIKWAERVLHKGQMIILGGEAGLESSEGSAWGAQTEFPSCQRVGMSIPGRVSEVSKDMQGTAREMPNIWHSCPAKELLADCDFTKQGFKDKWWAKATYVPLSTSFHKRNNRLAYTHQRASPQHKGRKWNTQLEETLTPWLRIFFFFSHFAADQWTQCPELVQVCMFTCCRITTELRTGLSFS